MQVIEELRSAHVGRVVEVHFNLTGAVLCDVQRIEQMLANLLQNALAYGEPDAPVKVRCKSKNGMFELSIANHGPAMPQSTIEQLFKPFWRAAARPANEGLGLGLFIVSEIARSHGGELHVDSSDQETRFTFRLKGETSSNGAHKRAENAISDGQPERQQPWCRCAAA